MDWKKEKTTKKRSRGRRKVAVRRVDFEEVSLETDEEEAVLAIKKGETNNIIKKRTKKTKELRTKKL